MHWKRKETYTALLFLAALALVGIVLIWGAIPKGGSRAMRQPQPVRHNVHVFMLRRERPVRGVASHPLETAPLLERAQGVIGRTEPALNKALDSEHTFIQLFGGVQRLMGRRVVEDMDADYTVVKMDDGTLDFTNLGAEPVDTTKHGKAVVRLKNTLERDFGTPLLYVQAPQKGDATAFPTGVTDYGNQNADRLLDTLESAGVDTLDLRPTLAAAQAEGGAELFFRTDHHWTPAGAFLGYQTLTQRLAADYGFVIDPIHTQRERYEITTYEDWFLGSQGKRVGTLYAGTDDIELWKPTFETDFKYEVPLYEIEREGPFEESLLFPERLEEKDYFNENPYTLYAGGDYSFARIYNQGNPDGKRILLLRDSFACALTPFLALDCGQLITIDLRYFKGDLMEYVSWTRPDVVVVMYTTGSTRLNPLFQFFPADDTLPGKRVLTGTRLPTKRG